MQPVDLCLTKVPVRALRMDPRFEQTLGGVDVADPCEASGIHQPYLDGLCAVAERGGQSFGSEFRVQGFRTEALGYGPDPINPTQTPGVREYQSPLVEVKGDCRIAWGFLGTIHDGHPTGHSQMDLEEPIRDPMFGLQSEKKNLGPSRHGSKNPSNAVARERPG